MAIDVPNFRARLPKNLNSLLPDAYATLVSEFQNNDDKRLSDAQRTILKVADVSTAKLLLVTKNEIGVQLSETFVLPEVEFQLHFSCKNPPTNIPGYATIEFSSNVRLAAETTKKLLMKLLLDPLIAVMNSAAYGAQIKRSRMKPGDISFLHSHVHAAAALITDILKEHTPGQEINMHCYEQARRD